MHNQSNWQKTCFDEVNGPKTQDNKGYQMAKSLVDISKHSKRKLFTDDDQLGIPCGEERF